MDPTLEQRNVFSNNTLSASGGDVRVQYGNNYNLSGTTEPSWADISRWLFGSEPVFSQRTFQASLQRRREEKRTGLWFLDGEAFRHWQTQPGSFLWLHGKTGCGKTMLCSSAINRLHSVRSGSSKQALIYHFFTVTDRRSRTSDTLVRALVYQLAGHNDETQARAKELYKQAGEDSGPADCDQLLSMFEDLSKVLTQVYIVIDSLDECVDQDETCAILERLCDWKVPGIRILASSNITQTRETETTLKKLKTDKIYVTTKAVNGDIEAHIRKLDLDQWEDNQRDKIVHHITAGSGGSFRWAIGQLIEIKKCDTEFELDEALESLPESLAGTYERILSGITTASGIQNLKILLCWLLYAARPLRIEELRQTVAIDWLNKPYFDPKKRLNQRPRILDQCTFLIAIDEDSEGSDMFALDDDEAATYAPDAGSTWHKDAVLRLAHSSVFQFFQETEKLSAHARRFSTAQPAGDLILAQSSLAYILYLDSTAEPTLATDHYPLFDYAIQYWYSHTQKAGPGNTEVLASLIREVLNTGWDIYRLVTYPNPSTRYNPWRGPQMPTPDYADHAGQGNNLCETCQKMQYFELQGPSGFRHGTYDRLFISAHNCKLCKMIYHSLIQFAVARYCQLLAESTLSEEDSERIGVAVDDEIHRNAGSAEVWLKAETQDPFLLISCYCYFGRLHLFTNPESSLANKVPGRAIHSHPGESSLETCAHWLQMCGKTHPKCLEESPPRFLPKRVIDVGGESVRLLNTQNVQEGRYVTLSHCWGAEHMPLTMTLETMHERMHGMPFNSLPSTYKDAIIITRHLGIRYLWIDSICIIQNSVEDWQVETQRMPDYYSNATLNIVAGVGDSVTSIFLPRIPPRFSSICVDESEDLFVGWLGTESYCDPRGLNVERYSDGWRYQSPPHRRAWVMQEIRLARRNLVFQADEGWLTSQLYMQCQEEVRWENGRTRRGTPENSTDWYELVEEYSGRQLAYLDDRLPGFSGLAWNHLRTVGGQCGHYLAGLWAGDLFRGLLWRVQEAGPFPPQYLAPSWSWAKVSGKVKHVWPLNAIVCAEALESHIDARGSDPFGRVVGGYIVIQGSLVQFEAVNGDLAAKAGEVAVNIRAGEECAAGVRIYYYLDHFDGVNTPIGDLYGLKITRRVALLLAKANQSNDVMNRVGLMIVAKPDTRKWASVLGQCVVKII